MAVFYIILYLALKYNSELFLEDSYCYNFYEKDIIEI